MKEFNLKEYLEKPELKVVTKANWPVRIICTDAFEQVPIIAIIGGETKQFFESGICTSGDEDYRLYLTDELTPFELAVRDVMSLGSLIPNIDDVVVREQAKKLLSMAVDEAVNNPEKYGYDFKKLYDKGFEAGKSVNEEKPLFVDEVVILEASSKKGAADWYGDYNYYDNPLAHYSNSTKCTVQCIGGSGHGYGIAKIRVETTMRFIKEMGWEEDLKYRTNG